MLNVFPIQFLAPLAYMILRVCVGFVFLHFGRKHFKNREILKDVLVLPNLPYGLFFTWYLLIIEIAIGLLFIFGIFTQVAALIAMLYVLDLAVVRKHVSHPLLPSKLVKILIFFASLSLFITGAGILAFDLPI